MYCYYHNALRMMSFLQRTLWSIRLCKIVYSLWTVTCNNT